MNTLILDKVSVTFPAAERPALEAISLTVQQGECVLLTGQSGCGKSTLLRVINGIVPQVIPGEIAGNMTLNGIVPAREPLWHLGRSVATVYQNPRRQFFCADPLGELAFGSENAGLHRDDILARAFDIAERLGIGHLLRRNIFSLSGGEIQRVAIGAALMDKPAFLLLDEPTSNLDNKSTLALTCILQSLRESGITLIIAEHRLWFLRDVVDRVIRMEGGRVMEDIPAAQFWQRDEPLRIQQGLRSLIRPESARLLMPTTGKRGITWQHPDRGMLMFPRGFITVLAGENGAGKSTLARQISGLEKSDDSILLDGKPFPRRHRLRRAFLVMQDVNRQLFGASVEQELQMGHRAMDPQSLRSVIDDLALDSLLDEHPMALSGGQQQRVVVALALLEQREVFIFDEPTSGLDYKGMERVASRLKQLAKRGAVVILITHDEELCARCADFHITLPTATSVQGWNAGAANIAAINHSESTHE